MISSEPDIVFVLGQLPQYDRYLFLQNVTERIPVEYLRYLLPWEDKPVPVKKIGAAFPVQLRHNNNRHHRNDSALASELHKLESDCELLNQITKAAYKLAYDPSSKGRTRRKRLQSYQKSLKKLQVGNCSLECLLLMLVT